MTRILRLLLIAAIALPLWQPVVAQVTPPANAEQKPWQFQSDYYVRNANTSSTETGWALGSFGTNRLTVAISGNTIYVKGFSKNCPDGWVQGTISGNTATFPTGQVFGEKDGVTYYFVGEHTTNVNNPQISNVIFDYDANVGMLTQQSFTATDFDGSTFKSFYYINESTLQNSLTGAVAYHEAVVMMEVKDYTMKTLAAEDIAGLANTNDGDMLHYEYTYDGTTYTGSLLDEVVVSGKNDEDETAAHAIALMRAVYTNPYLPGPKWRGYTTAGAPETQYPVSYAAVGTLSRSGNNNNYSYSFNDTYGWGISPGQGDILKVVNNNNRGYCSPTQFEPNEEGYTLLLVEMKDDFADADIWSNPGSQSGNWTIAQNNLEEYVRRTIKTVRILTDYKRVGTNVSRGTLFKIDANSLNRFFFLGKGQLRMSPSSYTYPYAYTTADGQSGTVNAYLGPYCGGSYNDSEAFRIFYHMFEQFSPAQGSGGIRKSDIYNELVHSLDTEDVTQTGFAVYHDCSSVPYAETDLGRSGHEFKMLPEDDPSAAPDVRDLLFFIPDYRMMQHSSTTESGSQFSDGSTHTRDSNGGQRYIYYHQNYAPRMDMYVVHLLPIKGEPVAEEGIEHVYQLEVNWKSNMASFLPATEQTFTLYRSITDAYGTTQFEPVYKTNHNGDWLTEDGKVIEVIPTTNEETGVVTYTYKVDGVEVNDPRVPIVMEGIYSLNELDYYDYIKMDPTGKQVTYYVVGQDAGEKGDNGQFILGPDGKRVHFLDAVESNHESYMIPGYQKNLRLTFRIDSETYSKFDFKNEKNNYWNQIIVANNKGTSVTANFFKVADNDGPATKIYFRRIADRSFGSEDPYDLGDLVATATVTGKGVRNNQGYITVTMEYNNQESFTGSRNGESYNKSSYTFNYPTTYINAQNQIVSLPEDQAEVELNNWTFYDNFTADVSENKHPGMYAYRAYFQAADEFPLYDFNDEGTPIPVIVDGVETLPKSKDVLSNPRLIKIYKITPSVNTPISLASVLADEEMTVTVPTESKLSLAVENASVAELWRYEVCRWAGAEPNNFTVYGHIQNQSGSYSVKFGEETYDVASQGATTTVNLEDKDLEENFGAYTYAPQAVAYSKRPALSDGTPDYNTFGGPRVSSAMGEVDLALATDVTNNPEMSAYKWYANGKWYSYYNILLKFSTLNIPAGYELYKVRAWRKVDSNILGEEYYENGTHNRNARLDLFGDGWYLYEDINFGDQLTDADEIDGSFLKMKKDNFLPNDGNSYHAAKIGGRSVGIAKPQDPDDTGYPEPLFADPGENEMRATFGALRMKQGENDNDGTLTELTTDIKVRAYFTRSTNPLIAVDNHAQLYVMSSTNNWNFSSPIATLSSNNGSTFTGTVVIPEGGAYIILSKEKGKGWNDEGYLLGAEWGDGDADVDPTWVFNLRTRQNSQSKVLKIDAGTYKMTVDHYVKEPVADDYYYAGSLTITKNTRSANAPTLRVTGDNFDYFVAEGEFNKTFTKDDIPTSIVENLNTREAIGVKYYNVAGIESDTPFDGVNIVVTRYSDGSTTTTKILK